MKFEKMIEGAVQTPIIKEIKIKFAIFGDIDNEDTIDYPAIEEKMFVHLLKESTQGGFTLYDGKIIEHRIMYNREEE